ncbi:hypothetical protein HOY80DRAFT_1061809 [Tuber brumale]|nr:hypothetical protein HOY80DRAFT_1061809 [Tuber brumale]
MLPTKTKPFPSSAPSLQASTKKKNSKMQAIRHTLRKLKVLLHLHHEKKMAVPRIVLTPPSESESDGEEDEEGGSLRSYVVSDERMVSCLDLRLGRGGGG